MSNTVICSGVHSGPNPSPGIGIARSLRLGFRRIDLIAADYSSSSSGLHWPEFSRRLVFDGWDQIDLDKHRARIADLTIEAFWISGLDIEQYWLATYGEHPHVLIPPLRALEHCRKPAKTAASVLGLNIPDSMSFDAAPQQLHSFCRSHDWNVWVKGPWYEALRAFSWMEVQAARSRLL